LDGRLESTYLILNGDWTGWRGMLRRVCFDPEPVLRDFGRSDFVNACGAVADLVLEEYRIGRQRVGPFNIWRKQFPDESEDVLLTRFRAEVDPWDFTPLEYHVNREMG